MRDGDAAGESGGGLCFAGHRGGDEAVAVGGASGGGEAVGEQADDGLLVAAGVDVEGDQVGGDDGHRRYFPAWGYGWVDAGVIAYTRTASRSI